MNPGDFKSSNYLSAFAGYFPFAQNTTPWNFITEIQQHILALLPSLDEYYRIDNNIAIHRSAVVENHVVLKGPLIISEGCFIGSHAYFRGGVLLGKQVTIGPGCEVKSTIILDRSSLAHFNFAGDSVIGSDVNMEAGSILANFHNDRQDKSIFVSISGKVFRTDVTKFGALVGDQCKIGANAVCSPGTILEPGSVVNRLELINQVQKPEK